MEIKHKLVTEIYYSIVYPATHRGMGSEIDDLMSGFELEEPDEVYSVLRDYEGDFEGIEIWNSKREDTQELIQAICDRYSINRDDIGDNVIKLTWI